MKATGAWRWGCLDRADLTISPQSLLIRRSKACAYPEGNPMKTKKSPRVKRIPRKSKPVGFEFDMHVWKKPECENMSTLYTISIGKFAVCIDAPLERAVQLVRDALEEAVE
jgi:hypothetical protein